MSKEREPYRKRSTMTYRATQAEVLAALGIHVPGNAGVSWSLRDSNTLEVLVEKTEHKAHVL